MSINTQAQQGQNSSVVQVPDLDINKVLYKESNGIPHERARGEQIVFANLVTHLEHHGFKPVSVYDGEETEKTPTMKDMMELVFNLDESSCCFRKEGFPKRSVYIVLGNSPEEIVADHSLPNDETDGFNAAMESFDPEEVLKKYLPTPNQEGKVPMVNKRTLTPVVSSTITALGHDADHSIMTVQFKNGSVYEYQNVEASLYERIVGAESVGKVFDAEIKKQSGKHPFTKVS